MPAPIRHRVLRGVLAAAQCFDARRIFGAKYADWTVALVCGAYYTSANEFCFRARCKSSLAVTRSACLRHASGGLEVRDPVRCRQLYTQG